MYNCALVVNAFYKSAQMDNMIKRLQEELLMQDVASKVLSNIEVLAYVTGNKISNTLKGFDLVFYMDKDIHIAQMLAKSGVLVLNTPESIRLSDDKMLTHVSLAEVHIPTVKSISAPLCYSKPDFAFLDKVEQFISYPIIVKENHGSMGRQVNLVNNRMQLEELYSKLYKIPHLYQPYMDYEKGTDYRIIVIGGKAVAYMKRYNSTDFRSNIEQNGKGYPITPSASLLRLAEIGAQCLGLDYAGVDVLRISKNKYVINEINSNAFFSEIESVSGVNVAKALAQHLKSRIINQN